MFPSTHPLETGGGFVLASYRRPILHPSVRRPEGIRWLRSDGKPDFGGRIHRKSGEARLLARRPVYTVTKTSTVLRALEEMALRGVRALPVVQPHAPLLEGIVTAMDMVNYLGGGELYNIVAKRHGGSIYSALLRESVSSIMNPNPIYATVEEDLRDILEKMVVNSIGVIPVVERDGTLWGIITEHDIVRHLMEKRVGVTVEQVMTRNVVFITSDATLGDAMKTMTKYGVRRLPVLEEERVWGMITAKHVVRFFGSHDVFRYIEGDQVSEALEAPVKLVGEPGYHSIPPTADVGEAATKMMEKGVSSLLVEEDGKLLGIITERDVLYALATTG